MAPNDSDDVFLARMKRMALTMAGFSAQAALEPAAEARVAELEAELAKADAVIAAIAPLPRGDSSKPILNEPCLSG